MVIWLQCKKCCSGERIMSLQFTPQKLMTDGFLKANRAIENDLTQALKDLRQQTLKKVAKIERTVNETIIKDEFIKKSKADKDAFFREKHRETEELLNKFIRNAASKRVASI